MISNLILCTNAIVPLFLLVLFGVFLKKINILDENFASKAITLVFKVCMPCMLFQDVSTLNISEQFNAKMVGYAVGVTLILFFAGIFLSAYLKDPGKRAAFAQGVFRSNYAVLGVPLTKAVFPPEIAVNASVLLSIIIPVYNILAVVLLTLMLNKKKSIVSILLGIIKNPLIVGAFIGAVFSLLHISLPTVIAKPVDYLATMCTPLSLIAIGVSFKWSDAKDTLRPAIFSALCKTLISPLVFVPVAILFGIDGGTLGVLFLFFAAPAAVTSYTMVRQMGGDYHMAGNILLISTATSFFTIFIGLFILKTIGLC